MAHADRPPRSSVSNGAARNEYLTEPSVPSSRLPAGPRAAILAAWRSVRAVGYQSVGDALLAALAAVLGDTFDAATREAWTLAYNLVAETMLDGAAAARPTGS